MAGAECLAILQVSLAMISENPQSRKQELFPTAKERYCRVMLQIGCYHSNASELTHLGHHLILCDPMDCSPPGFSVHGILQARKLEWVAMPVAMAGVKMGWPRSHSSWWQLWNKKERKKRASIGKHTEKLELLGTIGGNVKLCSHYGKQDGDYSKSCT